MGTDPRMAATSSRVIARPQPEAHLRGEDRWPPLICTAWNRVSRISDEEMQRLSADIVNRLYTFVFYWLTSGEPDRGIPLPTHWAPPQIEGSMAAMWPAGRDPAS